jgi:hypothetical protein
MKKFLKVLVILVIVATCAMTVILIVDSQIPPYTYPLEPLYDDIYLDMTTLVSSVSWMNYDVIDYASKGHMYQLRGGARIQFITAGERTATHQHSLFPHSDTTILRVYKEDVFRRGTITAY